MPLIDLIVTLVVVGFLLWLANTLIPMEAKVKSALNAVVILFVVLWILGLVFPSLPSVRIGR